MISTSSRSYILWAFLVFAFRCFCSFGQEVHPQATDITDHHRIYNLLLENAKQRILSRNAFLEASFPHEQKGFSGLTLRGPPTVALLSPYFPCMFTLVRSNFVSQPDHYDGGKWTCGVLESNHRSIHNPPFIVYSFGSNGDDLFERHLHSINKNIQIFVFDPTSKPIDTWNFRTYGLCGKATSFIAENKEYPCRHLPSIMIENNHTVLDILKIDIEGSEWEFFESIDWNSMKIGQFLVEIHDFKDDKPLSTLINTYLTPLENAGYMLFSIEPVCSLGCPGQYELGFLHKDWHPVHGFRSHSTSLSPV